MHTSGEEVYQAVTGLLQASKLRFDRVSQFVTDGAPSMLGKDTGFVALFQQRNPDAQRESLHCIIHRQALATKEMSEELADVLTQTISVVNFIRARALNRRLFRELCDEQDSVFRELLLHTEVRWLSRGKVLSRVYMLKDEIELFLTEQKHDGASNFSNVDFLFKLAFLADIISHVNDLNLALQGRSRAVYDLLESVSAFIEKLKLFKTKLNLGDLTTFENTSRTVANNGSVPILQAYVPLFTAYLTKLIEQFHRRFPDLSTEVFKTIRFPFRADANSLPTKLGVQLLELQSRSVLKERFNELSIQEFWPTLPDEEFGELKNMATRHLVKFASSYACESAFSVMNAVKSDCRSRLTNEHLENLLRISMTSYEPDYCAIMKSMPRLHCSH